MWRRPGKDVEKARNWEKARNRCGEGQELERRRPGTDVEKARKGKEKARNGEKAGTWKKARNRCGEGQ